MWIKQRLNTDPKQDIAWRQLDAATEYVKLVDSLNLHVMQDIQVFKALNIFSDEAFKEALQWKAGPADNFGPLSVFRWQTFNAEADSMETIELVEGINIDVECGERSCAWWWIISPHNDTSHTLKITLQISGIFSGGYPSECTTHTVVLEPGEKKEDITTYYGRQLDQNGVSTIVHVSHETKYLIESSTNRSKELPCHSISNPSLLIELVTTMNNHELRRGLEKGHYWSWYPSTEGFTHKIILLQVEVVLDCMPGV